jgi:lipopolysaccharide assembly outer membrane protein LptD (OstA)
LAIQRGAQRQSTADYMYNDLLRLQVEHSYDFEQSTRPFAPIFAKLDVRPGKYVSIDADAQYSVYDNTFLSHNVTGSLWDNRGDELYVDYRFEKKAKETEVKEDIQSLTGKLKVQLTRKFSVNGGNEYNFETDQRIETTAGFTYSSQCWQFDFSYTNEPNDWKVGFKIELFGLGEFRY